MQLPRPWFKNWPPELQCSVLPGRAAENADYLRNTLGQKWVDKRAAQPDRHPLSTDWRSGGAEAFLRLNTLAEDLRLLAATPGIETLIRDLKGVSSFKPAVHTVHVAALFARAGNEVLKFYPPSNESVPDFDIAIEGRRTAVEAKQLTKSGYELAFGRAADGVQEAVLRAVFHGGRLPEVQVIVKDPERVPRTDEVIAAAREGLATYSPGTVVRVRTELFNLRIFAAQVTRHFIDCFAIQVLAPAHATEASRIERLVNKANSQLKRNTAGNEPALICIGIGEHQDPHAVAELIRARFAKGDFSSTGGIILHRPARHAGPGPVGAADMLSFIANTNARAPIGNFQMRSAGIVGDLLSAGASTVAETVSCYPGGGQVLGKVGDDSEGAYLGFSLVSRIEIAELA